ncbi:hypothetical protein HDU67_009616 [Dinochytrium kinnereticum]|nr:hypothetical protein HDU67_009616 [Dinochytrium kinnereticum]
MAEREIKDSLIQVFKDKEVNGYAVIHMTSQSLIALGIESREDRISLLAASRSLLRGVTQSTTLDHLPEYLPISPPVYDLPPSEDDEPRRTSSEREERREVAVEDGDQTGDAAEPTEFVIREVCLNIEGERREEEDAIESHGNEETSSVPPPAYS